MIIDKNKLNNRPISRKTTSDRKKPDYYQQKVFDTYQQILKELPQYQYEIFKRFFEEIDDPIKVKYNGSLSNELYIDLSPKKEHKDLPIYRLVEIIEQLFGRDVTGELYPTEKDMGMELELSFVVNERKKLDKQTRKMRKVKYFESLMFWCRDLNEIDTEDHEVIEFDPSNRLW